TGIEWMGSRIVGWLAFLLFALNPHLIYLFTTPENEPLMILCAVGMVYYLTRQGSSMRNRSTSARRHAGFACGQRAHGLPLFAPAAGAAAVRAEWLEHYRRHLHSRQRWFLPISVPQR